MQSPNFKNCDAGVGDLYVGNTNVGFLEKFQARKSGEALKLFNKTPEVFRGQILTKRQHIWTASLYEGSMENIGLFSGADQVVNIAGSTVTIADGDNQEKTFAVAPGDGATQSITLDGPNIGSLVIKNVAEDDTFDVNADYILINSTTGRARVYRNPGGAIPSLATVRLTYTHTPPASKRLLIGDSSRTTIPTLLNLRFEHENPANDAKKRNCIMHRGSCSGELKLDFEDGKFQMLDVEIEAEPDDTKKVSNGGAGDELGYWDWID